MAKHCERCGSRLKRGKCPVCDNGLLNSQNERGFNYHTQDILWFIVLALILGTSIVCSESSPYYENIQTFVWDNFHTSHSATTKVDRDIYEDVTYALNKTGDSVDLTLPAGNYIVGKDIPEGVYKVTNLSGFGPIKVNDDLNHIRILTSLIMEKETSEYFSYYLEDVRLYQGAIVTVSTNEMRFVSENARNDLMIKREKNPLTEEFTISSPIMVGETVPAGTYDIIVVEGEGIVSSENYEYGINESMSSYEKYYDLQEFKNVQLVKYNKLDVEDGLTVKLVPSEYQIGRGN